MKKTVTYTYTNEEYHEAIQTIEGMDIDPVLLKIAASEMIRKLGEDNLYLKDQKVTPSDTDFKVELSYE